METIRKSFADELREMKQDILKMGSVVEEMLAGSMHALQLRDTMLADEVIAKDDVVDGYNVVIEQRCLRLLALQQPMAGDLRTIAAGLYIIKDVERMGSDVLDLQEIDRTQVALTGGKAAQLGELSRIDGVRVPAGFCVTK